MYVTQDYILGTGKVREVIDLAKDLSLVLSSRAGWLTAPVPRDLTPSSGP